MDLDHLNICLCKACDCKSLQIKYNDKEYNDGSYVNIYKVKKKFLNYSKLFYFII